MHIVNVFVCRRTEALSKTPGKVIAIVFVSMRALCRRLCMSLKEDKGTSWYPGVVARNRLLDNYRVH